MYILPSAKKKEKNASLARRRLLTFLPMVACCSLFARTNVVAQAKIGKEPIPRKSIQRHIDSLTIYLNRIRTLKADIEQTNPNGSKQTGTLMMKRPGLMNLSYHPPSKIQIIADSRSLIVVDPTLEEANYIPLAETPAYFFLQRVIDLGPEKVQFLNFKEDDRTMFFDVSSAEVENVGMLRMIFQKRPLSLLGWSIIEPDNTQTVIFLKDLKINVAVDEASFRFSNPWQ